MTGDNTQLWSVLSATHTAPAWGLQAQCVRAAAGAYSAGLITEEQRQDILHNACPGAGACGGMYTANTVRYVLIRVPTSHHALVACWH